MNARALAGSVLLALAAASLHAPGRADVGKPPPPVAAALADARLSGEGLLRWFGLRVYEARLWVGPEGLEPSRLHALPFALDLRYARRLEGGAIAETSHREIARMGFGTEQQRRGWLDAMRRIFPDVADGDRITGVHRPGAGVNFYKNDRRIGSVEDPDFGPAFFAIWLDPRTIAPDLRQTLLAGAQAQRTRP